MLYIEINNRGAYIYTEIVAGAGGLPVGTAGKIHLLLETEADILAGILMMKRGCTIIPLCIGEENENHTALLQKFSAQKINSIFFKNKLELMKYIQENKIHFLVTGENFEQKREYPKELVVFRPLIAYANEEIKKEQEKFRQMAG